MTNSSINHLVKMANDIANNLGAGKTEEQAAMDIASHMHRFWTPAMLLQITSAPQETTNNLNSKALHAVKLIAEEAA